MINESSIIRNEIDGLKNQILRTINLGKYFLNKLFRAPLDGD